MKKQTAIFLFCIAFFLILTACQDTPEIEPILDRSGDYLQVSEQESRNKDDEADLLNSFPPSYSSITEVENQSLTIHYDASIVLPDASQFPVTRVSQMKLTAEDYKELVTYFAPSSNVYYIPERTKEDWEFMLIEALRGDYVDGDYIQTESSIALAKEIEQKIVSAPTEKSLLLFDATLSNYLDGEYFECSVISDNQKSAYMRGKKNSNEFMYSRTSDFVLQDEEMVLMGDAIVGEPQGTQINPGVDELSARYLADNVLVDLGLRSYVIDSALRARIVTYSGKIISSGWVFYYVPELNDLCLFTMQKSFTTKLDHLPSIVAPWRQENIEIYVDSDGIGIFNWVGATEIIELEAPTIELLCFDRLIDFIDRQIRYTYLQADIYVNEIKLGASLLSIPHEENIGRIVPTWYVSYIIEVKRNNPTRYRACMAFTAHDGGYVEPRLTVEQLMEYTITYQNAIQK